MHRLLAIDIDGTLMNSHDELTPATRAALGRAGEAGIHVVLATGRRYSHALPLVEPLGIDVPLVTASGALVKDPIDHSTLYRAEFERGCWSMPSRLSTVQVMTRCCAQTLSPRDSTTITTRNRRARRSWHTIYCTIPAADAVVQI